MSPSRTLPFNPQNLSPVGARKVGCITICAAEEKRRGSQVVSCQDAKVQIQDYPLQPGLPGRQHYSLLRSSPEERLHFLGLREEAATFFEKTPNSPVLVTSLHNGDSPREMKSKNSRSSSLAAQETSTSYPVAPTNLRVSRCPVEPVKDLW